MKIFALLLTVGMVTALAILIAVRLQRGAQGAARFARRRVLGAAEQVLHHRVRLALTPQFQVLARVGYAHFLDVADGNAVEALLLRARARDKHAHVLVCDHGYNPLCVIELDDGGRADAGARALDEALRQAGIGLLRYNVQAMPRPEQIRSDFARTRLRDARLEIHGCAQGEAAASTAAQA